MGALPDDARRADDLGAGRVGPELQRARVHAQQGQAVCQDVVHLPRDGLAGEPLRLLGPQRRLPLGAPGAVPETEHELPLGAHEHAPADDRGGEDEDEEDRPGIGDVGVGAQPEEERGQQEGGAADPGHVPEGPVHGEGEEGDEAGAARGVGHEADRDHRHGEADGPAAAQPDGRAGERSQHLVEDGEGLRQAGFVPDRLHAEEPDEHGQQEAGEVDDPVTRGPRGPHGPPSGAGLTGGGCVTGHGGEVVVEQGRRQQPAPPREGGGLRPRLVTIHGRQIYAGTGPVTSPAPVIATKVAARSTFVGPRPRGGVPRSEGDRPAADERAGAAGRGSLA